MMAGIELRPALCRQPGSLGNGREAAIHILCVNGQVIQRIAAIADLGNRRNTVHPGEQGTVGTHGRQQLIAHLGRNSGHIVDIKGMCALAVSQQHKAITDLVDVSRHTPAELIDGQHRVTGKPGIAVPARLYQTKLDIGPCINQVQRDKVIVGNDALLKLLHVRCTHQILQGLLPDQEQLQHQA